jgi:hypothetical protein
MRDPRSLVRDTLQAQRGHLPIRGAPLRVFREHLEALRGRLRFSGGRLPTSSGHRMTLPGRRMAFPRSRRTSPGHRRTGRRRLPTSLRHRSSFPRVFLDESCPLAIRRGSRHAPGGRLLRLGASREARRRPPPSRSRSLLTIRTTRRAARRSGSSSAHPRARGSGRGFPPRRAGNEKSPPTHVFQNAILGSY